VCRCCTLRSCICKSRSKGWTSSQAVGAALYLCPADLYLCPAALGGGFAIVIQLTVPPGEYQARYLRRKAWMREDRVCCLLFLQGHLPAVQASFVASFPSPEDRD